MSQGTGWASANGATDSAGPSSDSEGNLRPPNGAQRAGGSRQNGAQQPCHADHAEQTNGGGGTGRPRRSNAGQRPQRLADVQAVEVHRHAAARAEHAASPPADSRSRAGAPHPAAAQSPARASAPLPELPPDFQPSRCITLYKPYNQSPPANGAGACCTLAAGNGAQLAGLVEAPVSKLSEKVIEHVLTLYCTGAAGPHAAAALAPCRRPRLAARPFTP